MMNFMEERLTEDNGEEFLPSRYTLKSKNDVIIAPYRTYELFFEITFHIIQKLGAYEDIGTPEELKKLKERPKGIEYYAIENTIDEYGHTQITGKYETFLQAKEDLKK